MFNLHSKQLLRIKKKLYKKYKALYNQISYVKSFSYMKK